MSEPKAFLSIAEASAIIGVSPARGKQLADAHVFPVVRLTPGRRRVPRQAFDEWLRQLNTQALEWHYHPERPYRDCHLHVQEPIPARPSFGKLHIPTGRVAFEDVLLFLIDEYGLRAGARAREMLLKERAAFDRTQRWAGRRPPA